MVEYAKKAAVTLEDIPLSATGAVTWRFITGVRPYTTTFQVHKSQWKKNLKDKVGKPLTLKIIDSRGAKTEIKDVYILHNAPSDSKNRISFVVADRRWKWSYKLVVRDYNVPRKTGDKTALNDEVPIEIRVNRDHYDYLPYSLDWIDTTGQGQPVSGEKWTPQNAVLDMMEVLEGEDVGGKWRLESWPLMEGEGEFELKNVQIRDQGGTALARLLSYIPGADVYINDAGQAVIFDAANLTAAERYVTHYLPPATRDGDNLQGIDRAAIRPSRVSVFYQREFECIFRYKDDYSIFPQHHTFSNHKEVPYLINVCQTSDPSTDVYEFDAYTGQNEWRRSLPAGTWVRFEAWLVAMDKIKPDNSMPWTFETIARAYPWGTLDALLGGGGQADVDENGKISLRIAVIKQHFRKTFQINPRYTERCRDLLNVRVACLDPVTGARAPSSVWGQACVVPNKKGHLMATRKGGTTSVNRNINYIKPTQEGGEYEDRTIEAPPGPAQVVWADKDLGIFHVRWVFDPYGTIEKFIPSLMVKEDSQQTPHVSSRDLAKQLTHSMGAGVKATEMKNGHLLAEVMEMKVVLTLAPAAPNSKRQFHREDIDVVDLPEMFKTQFGIEKGRGPDLEVFIPPGEVTARYAWDFDDPAEQTVVMCLGLDEDDPWKAGLPEPEWMESGFVFVNREREVKHHARATAIEHISTMADSIQGRRSSTVPKDGLSMRGNMTSASIQVSAAPSAKVSVINDFSGQQKLISRMALLPDSARRLILGIIPFKGGE